MDPTHNEERYSFSRAGHLGVELTRALHLIEEQFARNLTHTMSAWLRTEFLASVKPIEQKNFSAFVSSLPEVAYLASLRMEPMGAHGCLLFDLALAPPIVDVLLGGSGRSGMARELTEIEEAIVTSVLGMIMREWNKGWPSTIVGYTLEKREREGQIQRLMAPTEKVVCIEFEVVLPEATGMLIFCLPAVVISSVLRKLITQRDRPRRRSQQWAKRMEERLLASRFTNTLRFPVMRIAANVLAGLEAGQILPLPLSRNSKAVLHVGSTEVFYATPVSSQEHRAAQLMAAIKYPSPSEEPSSEERDVWIQ